VNTFKRKWLYGVLAMLGLLLAGCSTAEKRYAQLVQDTNDRIERARTAEAAADVALAKALEVAAVSQPALVAAVTSNVMMARALRGSGAAGQPFHVPPPPRSFSEEVRAWVGTVAPFLVAGYQANRSAAVQMAGYAAETDRYVAGERYETARVEALAGMAIGLRPTAPNVTTTTYQFGRDGNLGGTQQNNNSTTTTCTAGNGAPGGNGGNGGDTGAGAPGAAGGPGGNAC
jgi:hypothetical protein